MSTGLFSATTIPVLEQAVNFAQSRHAVLAGNIANLDTPGYRVRDLSPDAFHERLRAAIEQHREPGPVADKYGNKEVDPFAELTTTLDELLYHDDSTGNLESQVAAISKNHMEHNLALAILTSQFRLLQAAISERA